eukprot:COSAG02_NODE_5332_length_4430_cov_2.540753_1_plen_202_part_00
MVSEIYLKMIIFTWVTEPATQVTEQICDPREFTDDTSTRYAFLPYLVLDLLVGAEIAGDTLLPFFVSTVRIGCTECSVNGRSLSTSRARGRSLATGVGYVWLAAAAAAAAVVVVVVVVVVVEQTADKSWWRGMSSLTAQIDVSDGLAVRAHSPDGHFAAIDISRGSRGTSMPQCGVCMYLTIGCVCAARWVGGVLRAVRAA